MRIERVAYHRNGVSGEPFYAVTFTDEGRNMLGVVFDYAASREEEFDDYVPRFPAMPRTAVFERELLGAGEIAFGVNSWRGDRYDRALRLAIAKHEREQAGVVA